MAEVKKVIQRIYNFDFSKAPLLDKQELMITETGNEFVNTFIRRDFDKGIIITPSGYTRGLVYEAADNGSITNPPTWYPDIISFNLNIYGLKRNGFYRLTVKAKNTTVYNSLTDTTDDRNLQITNDNQELLINEDLSNIKDFKPCETIFRANSNECNLLFKLGKITINDIIIDEVEINGDIKEEKEEKLECSFDSGKSNIVAYGVFMKSNIESKRFTEMQKITGKGINLYFDKNSSEYILERDNYEDSIGAPFTNANYIVDFNFNKAPHAEYEITDISNDASPNTLKQGYIRFKMKNCENGFYNIENGRLAFIITKIL